MKWSLEPDCKNWIVFINLTLSFRKCLSFNKWKLGRIIFSFEFNPFQAIFRNKYFQIHFRCFMNVHKIMPSMWLRNKSLSLFFNIFHHSQHIKYLRITIDSCSLSSAPGDSSEGGKHIFRGMTMMKTRKWQWQWQCTMG